MKIYIAHSTGCDYHNDLYHPIRQSDLNARHAFVLPHESSDEYFDSHTLFFNANIDLVVAEVSYASTGLGIELGWADSAGIPIACLYRSDSKPSGALRAVTDRIVPYSSPKELIHELENLIESGQK
jgi:hypothetical protein